MSATVSLQQLTDQLDALEQRAAAEIADAADAQALEDLRVGLLGKKGRISAVLGAMGKLKVPGQEAPVDLERARWFIDLLEVLLGSLSEDVPASDRERLEQLLRTQPVLGVLRVGPPPAARRA